LALRETFAKLGVVTGSERMVPVLRQAWKAARASDATLLVRSIAGRKQRDDPLIPLHDWRKPIALGQ
jgi:hypothetical protein